jgi:hypothetical protein
LAGISPHQFQPAPIHLRLQFIIGPKCRHEIQLHQRLDPSNTPTGLAAGAAGKPGILGDISAAYFWPTKLASPRSNIC